MIQLGDKISYYKEGKSCIGVITSIFLEFCYEIDGKDWVKEEDICPFSRKQTFSNGL